MHQIKKLDDFVLVDGDRIMADSRTIARHFGKWHHHVLRDIRKILKAVPTSFAETNFGFSREINNLANGKPEGYFRMTKDGFMLLVMGFTGEKALAMKLAFIEAFNRMADFIQAQAASAFAEYNRALQQHLSDKRHVSSCARDMRRWQDEKPKQLNCLRRLEPQLPLFPALAH